MIEEEGKRQLEVAQRELSESQGRLEQMKKEYERRLQENSDVLKDM